MVLRPRHPSPFLLAVSLCVVLGHTPSAAQAPALEVARYRLTEAVFAQFRQASDLIVQSAKEDRTGETPLFTREIAVTGDVVAAAEALEARLRHDAFARALSTAGLPAREYTRFALALIAARLAHGFIQSGLMKTVPAGAPADNIAFVATRETEVDRLLSALGADLPWSQ